MTCGPGRGDYLPKTALPQDHEEVKVRQLHAILVAVAVVLGNGVGGGALRVLGAGADLGSLWNKGDW